MFEGSHFAGNTGFVTPAQDLSVNHDRSHTRYYGQIIAENTPMSCGQAAKIRRLGGVPAPHLSRAQAADYIATLTVGSFERDLRRHYH